MSSTYFLQYAGLNSSGNLLSQICSWKIKIHLSKQALEEMPQQLHQFVYKRKLRESLGIVDYTHLCCLFLNKNDRKLKHQQEFHSKKFFDLGFENSQMSHNPDKVIFNCSSHILTEREQSLLCKGDMLGLKHWDMLIIYFLFIYFIMIYTTQISPMRRKKF